MGWLTGTAQAVWSSVINQIDVYKETSAGVDEDAVVSRHGELIRRIAYHLIARLPATVQLDDLFQAGMLGLLEAAKSYDAARGASFETYAGIRVRGAMIDEIRRLDWTPRSVHKHAREIGDAIRQVEAGKKSPATAVEVAAALGVGMSRYQQWLADISHARVMSFEQALPGGEEASATQAPEAHATRAAFHSALADAIEILPEREKLVMSLYYDEELNLREIGEVLGVSESRVCQLHGQLMLRLRATLADWVD